MATFKASLSVAPSEQRSCERTAILLDHMQQKHHKPFEVPGLAQEVLSELPRLKAPAYGNPIWPAYAVASELMRKANGSPNMHAQLSNQLLSKLPAIAVHNPSAAHGLFRAVLDEHLERNKIPVSVVNQNGFAWQGGRLSPATGGPKGNEATLVLYTPTGRQPAIATDNQFSGPLVHFAAQARRRFGHTPERWNHYDALLTSAEQDLRKNNGLPFKEAVLALKPATVRPA